MNLTGLYGAAINLRSAVEFKCFIMLTMQGQRAIRFEPEYWRGEFICDHPSLIYIEIRKNLPAYEFVEYLTDFCDVYVVKDSPNGYFVDIQWVDNERYPEIKTAKDVLRLVQDKKTFGYY